MICNVLCIKMSDNKDYTNRKSTLLKSGVGTSHSTLSKFTPMPILNNIEQKRCELRSPNRSYAICLFRYKVTCCFNLNAHLIFAYLQRLILCLVAHPSLNTFGTKFSGRFADCLSKFSSRFLFFVTINLMP